MPLGTELWILDFSLLKKNFNVYLFLRERERERVGEGQRQRETRNLKQAPGSKPSAQRPKWGLNPQTVR